MAKVCFNVIIAGGKGTRFWPLSRTHRPKQILKLLSPNSLIRETAERVYPLAGRKQTMVVTIADQLSLLRRELPGIPKNNFIAEPQGKNTAPCIGLAALEVMRRDAEAVMIVLPADHWVADIGAFRTTLKTAVELAGKTDYLITIGIKPDYPETGYGYVMKNTPVGPKSNAAFVVKRFVEKPTLPVARRLIRQHGLWNSGIFVWKASSLLAALRRYQPAIYQSLEKIKAAAPHSLTSSAPRLRNVIAEQYNQMPNLSIDYAVMENAGAEGKVLTLEGQFGWSDVGSWAAVYRMSTKDRNGNASQSRWVGVDTRNCLIHAPNRLVVLLGVENTVVVDTPDALLVANLERSQEVREVVDALNRERLSSYTT
ncbi:MAG TPA: mannose-1-phosphate guanylyltransferase [Candidatus Binatia bacterium]